MSPLIEYKSTQNVIFPYYKFIYEGFENKYLKLRAKSLRAGSSRHTKSTEIPNYREWFINETHKQLNISQDYYRFEKAICIIVHGFSSMQSTDLDNYDYKYVIDGVKSLQIIQDDSFKELSLLTVGVASESDNLTCYVVPEEYVIEFLQLGLVPLHKPAPSSIKRINLQILEAERIQILEESKFF